jgi:hypothetical protein
MIKHFAALLSLAFIVSCASTKKDSCPACASADKTASAKPTASVGGAASLAKKGASATPQGQAMNAAAEAAKKQQ